MKNILNALAITGLVFFGALSAQADPIPTTPTAVPNSGSVWGNLDPTGFDTLVRKDARGNIINNSDKDYSNAVGYDSTGHNKGRWQGLGTSNGVDNGVLWSVGGSAFGTSENLVLGEDVTFKFLFWQSNNGNHRYDQIFSAFDYGQDGVFNNPFDTILYEKVDTIWQIHDDRTLTNARYLEFEVTITVPETMTIGSTWLRTRVHCNHTTFGNITAYNWLAQGETEDYQLNIVGNEVPEPATMLLFGSGLLGLAGLRKRGRRK